MKIKFTKVLLVGPHADDVELGLGGTVSRIIEEGCEVKVIIFSTAVSSLLPGFTQQGIVDETYKSLKQLGVTAEQIVIEDFEVRRFSDYRQEILEILCREARDFNPDAVFVPASSDTHQDHAVVHAEAIRGFRRTSVFGYELPWNNKGFDPTFLIELEERHINAKETALGHYLSQAHRPYFQPGLLKNLAALRATVVGVQYGEAFEVIRMVS